MFYRSPAQISPRPTSKLKQITSKLWYFCVNVKFSCSVWMLLAFGFFVIYCNDNYMNISISLPSTAFLRSALSSSSSSGATSEDISYLNPNAFHSVYGTCPYTNPMYPSIGPDVAYICPSKKPYRIGASWYLKEDILKYRKREDKEDLIHFFDAFTEFKRIMDNNTDITDTKRLKRNNSLHLSYQYASCLSESDIKTIHDEWPAMVQFDDELFAEYGYKSWDDVMVCFDKVLCMNDDYYGGVSYSLFLDEKSQKMMQRFVAKSEEIQKRDYNIELTLKRMQQQSFHVTFGTVSNTKNYDLFDAKKLMDIINHEMKRKFPCIRLTKPPAIENYICKNTKKLQKDTPKFHWECKDL